MYSISQSLQAGKWSVGYSICIVSHHSYSCDGVEVITAATTATVERLLLFLSVQLAGDTEVDIVAQVWAGVRGH